MLSSVKNNGQSLVNVCFPYNYVAHSLVRCIVGEINQLVMTVFWNRSNFVFRTMLVQ